MTKFEKCYLFFFLRALLDLRYNHTVTKMLTNLENHVGAPAQAAISSMLLPFSKNPVEN